MPTYDYVCDACGHEFEWFQSMSDARLTKCPKCGKRALRRKVGAGAGIIFKGSGFYQTDYKNTSQPPSASGEGSSESKPASKDAPKEASKGEKPASKDGTPSAGGSKDAAPTSPPPKGDSGGSTKKGRRG